jgi:hypothetical protein
MNGYILNQFFTTQLNVGGGITNSQTTGIVIQSVAGLDITKPGIALLTYADPLDTAVAEWITYTSINGSNELQGVTRGQEGFSAKSHSNEAVVAFPLSESHVNNLTAALAIGGVYTNLVTTTLDEDTMSSNSATALATQQSIKSYVDTAVAGVGSTDGWNAATGTWTYASATTITVPSGAAALYQKGDKFKLTANSVVLYGYIVGVADTLLTVRGDALTNHAFTANYFSKAANPQGFPTSFAWTPTITGYGTPPATPFARFHLVGTIACLQVATGNATSNATGLSVSLPITARTLSGATWRNKPSNLVDNGTNSTTADFVFIDSGSTTATLAKNTSSTGFTASGSKGVDFQIWYEI